MGNIKFSQAAVDLIAKFEGYRSKPYLDSVNIPTIGYVTTFYEDGKKVTMNDAPINEARAKEILLHYFNEHMLPDFQKYILVELEQHKIDALACLVYNIGNNGFKTSSVLKDINNNITSGAVIKEHWNAWNKAGGKVIPGLVTRRGKEFDYFEKGVL